MSSGVVCSWHEQKSVIGSPFEIPDSPSFDRHIGIRGQIHVVYAEVPVVTAGWIVDGESLAWRPGGSGRRAIQREVKADAGVRIIRIDY